MLRKTREAVAKRTGGAIKPKQSATAERPGSWHLARTETERRLSEFEFKL
jgi:hypothetical protein